jgi:hypothetical protein
LPKFKNFHPFSTSNFYISISFRGELNQGLGKIKLTSEKSSEKVAAKKESDQWLRIQLSDRVPA